VCISVHLMLAGLAIENLCKGFIASKLSPEEKGKLEEGKSRQWWYQTHNIRKLLSKAGLTTSDKENELLRRIQDTVYWLGRYPAPKSSEALVNELNAATDVQHVNIFLSRLEAYVRA
jgi:hypothetical protein